MNTVDHTTALEAFAAAGIDFEVVDRCPAPQCDVCDGAPQRDGPMDGWSRAA